MIAAWCGGLAALLLVAAHMTLQCAAASLAVLLLAGLPAAAGAVWPKARGRQTAAPVPARSWTAVLRFIFILFLQLCFDLNGT